MRPGQKDPRAGLRRVAITIDDLGTSDASSEPALSAALLGHLRRYQAPVAAFVNCRKMRPDVLQQWDAAGATIGNHTQAHLSVDDTTGPRVSQAWWSGVTACDEQLRTELGRPIRYFRFPYLRTGASESQKRDAARRLASLGYRVAPVSSPTTEWLLADYYGDARAYGDEALANEVVQRYVVHMVESLEHAEQLARAKGIERMAHITLIHANSLSADHLGDALEALEGQGWDFVSLDEALSDPVYARRDAFAGKHGYSWLARIEPAAKANDEDVFGKYEAIFAAEFGGRVEALKSARAAEAAAQVVEP
jgi:peptidoglycan/xylan/chitin deacetylase (PgdA/CDA1 family)